jgi:hypothetical protein
LHELQARHDAIFENTSSPLTENAAIKILAEQAASKHNSHAAEQLLANDHRIQRSSNPNMQAAAGSMASLRTCCAPLSVAPMLMQRCSPSPLLAWPNPLCSATW